VKDVDFGKGTVRCLMRGFRESEDTFAALRDGTVPDLFTEGPRDEPVAFGIVGFRRTAAGPWRDRRMGGLGAERRSGFAD
jgi:hypothetical protein